MIKYKKWVDKISRPSLYQISRFNKFRLEKNERISPFDQVLLKKFKNKIKSHHLNAYPETYILYKTLAKYHDLKKNNFLITAGSDAGIKNCFDVFVSHSSYVVSLQPTFAMVDVYCKLYKAKNKLIKFNNKLELKINNLLKTINYKTSLIIIANPNSPTGTILDLIQIKKIVLKALKKNIPVLIDEAYFGFSKVTAIKLINKYSNLIISRTFSKSFGIAGVRIGYLIANSKLINILRKFKPMYEVNSLGILLAETLIKNRNINKSYISQTLDGKKFLLKYFKKKKIKTINTNANFILIELKKRKKKIIRNLEKKGVLVGKSIKINGMENFIRITVGPEKILAKIIPIFEKYY